MKSYQRHAANMRLFVVVVVVTCLLQVVVVRCGVCHKASNFFVDLHVADFLECANDIEAVRNDQWPESRELKCYMYCLWEQFGIIDDKRELSLNGMLTFFQRIPAYRTEVHKAIGECKGIGKYLAKGDNCQYAYTFNKCYAKLSPRTYYLF